MLTEEQRKESHRLASRKYASRMRQDPAYRPKLAARMRAYRKRWETTDPTFIPRRRASALKRYYQVIRPNKVEVDKFRTRSRRGTQNYRARKQEIRVKLQALLGGKCVNCGIEDYRLLDFDHIDPQTKTMNISQKLSLPFEELVEEIKKCQLLCPNCHRLKSLEEKHYDPRIREFRNPKKSREF